MNASNAQQCDIGIDPAKNRQKLNTQYASSAAATASNLC
jgi:hypothetical protein